MPIDFSEASEQINWPECAEAVALGIFGEVNQERSRPPESLRFGNQGSKDVDLLKGLFWDHEEKVGGGVYWAVGHYKRMYGKDALEFIRACKTKYDSGELRANGYGANGSKQHSPRYIWEIQATYKYTDANGHLLYQKRRYLLKYPNGGGYVVDENGKPRKIFSKRRPDPSNPGMWIDDVEGVPDVLFRLPHVRKAIVNNETILILEGERKVGRAEKKLSFTGTCGSGGSSHWPDEYAEQLRGADVVLVPDNDVPGRGHMIKVAQSLVDKAKRIRVLELPGLPDKGDLVDWHDAGGTAEQLRALVAAAPEWMRPEAKVEGPRPLMRELSPPDPYPTSALGPLLSAAACALQDKMQSPLAMCGQSVLATTTLAVQALADITLPTGATVPLAEFFVSIAPTGERKSSTDKEALWAHRKYEAELWKLRDEEMIEYEAKLKTWKIAQGALEKRSKSTKQDLSQAGLDAIKSSIKALGPEPQEPLVCMLTAPEPTYEGLCKLLSVGLPSVGIFADEGGQFLGGHAMTAEAKLRTITGLSKAWDGDPIRRVRGADGSLYLPGRRVSLHLMCQPTVAAIALNDPLLINQGLVSRLLVTAPASLIGTRFQHQRKPETAVNLTQFHARMLELLKTPLPLVPGKRNELAPPAMSFTKAASDRWWEFHDHVEHEMREGGAFEAVQGLAAKLPEHAARIAGIRARAETDSAEDPVGTDALDGGIDLAEHYALEQKRLIGAAQANPDLQHAQKLLSWLQAGWKEALISLPDIYRKGPGAIRDKATATRLVKILEDHGWLTKCKSSEVVAGQRRKEAWQIEGRAP